MGGEGGGGGLNREGGLIIFLPLKRVGLLERGAYLSWGGGGLNRGFTVYRRPCFFFTISRSV